MHFLFSLLRIKGLYMFRALLAHPQEALYKRHLLYCVRLMSVGCTRIEVELTSPCTAVQPINREPNFHRRNKRIHLDHKQRAPNYWL
jgi:hypothetical protein